MDLEVIKRFKSINISCPPNAEDKKISGKLKDIVRTKIKMDERSCRQNKVVLENIKSTVVRKMKSKDPLFDDIFVEIYHTGSSFSNLRVKEPNEFDLDLIIKFPFKPSDYEVITNKNNVHPSFAKIKLKNTFSQLIGANHPKFQGLRKMEKWFNKDNYLMIETPLNWIKGLVDTVLPEISVDNVKKITRKTSGPAVTLSAELGHDTISIDLVPVFKFRKSEHWPRNIDKLLALVPQVEELDKYWLIVPKCVKNDHVTPAAKAIMWRMDYPDIEKKIIHNVGCVKLVIKLLKLFRNENKMDQLASYHLKTFMMIEVLINRDPTYWSEGNLGLLFMNALEKLAQVLDKCYLPFIFDDGANLFEGRITEATAKNFSGRIKTTIKKIRKDQDYLNQCFNCTV